MSAGGAAVQAMVARVGAAMEEHGWSVVALPAEEGRPPFAYTVGLEKNYGHPEIVLVGEFASKVVQGVLNAAGAKVKEGAKYEAGQQTKDVVGRFEVAFRGIEEEVAAKNMPMAQLLQEEAIARPVRALQIFLPDAAGRFPWQRGCEARMARSQKALG
ncbi:MAG TPA: DUF4262 domain-containing protein [Acetobacteraceae bacterium]|jgi:hypothetical protein|nr:DUF4262 domain-containing protein [Acetobacteraceae bacterium]